MIQEQLLLKYVKSCFAQQLNDSLLPQMLVRWLDVDWNQTGVGWHCVCHTNWLSAAPICRQLDIYYIAIYHIGKFLRWHLMRAGVGPLFDKGVNLIDLSVRLALMVVMVMTLTSDYKPLQNQCNLHYILLTDPSSSYTLINKDSHHTFCCFPKVHNIQLYINLIYREL